MGIDMHVYRPVELPVASGISYSGFSDYLEQLRRAIAPGANIQALDQGSYPGWIDADSCQDLAPILKDATPTNPGAWPDWMLDYHKRLIQILDKAVWCGGMVYVH